MIYTVTFNPSLDYVVHLDNLELGATNRTTSEQMLPGGKGINVSVVLKNLGIANTALGFISGFTGDEIEKCVKKNGCLTDFIRIDNGFSRINIKLKSDSETEINGQGPDITKEAVDKLFEKINKLNSDDILVLAGSIPNTMSDNIYYEIMKSIEDKKIKVVVDATRDLLVNVLEKHPFLIKPNNHELGDIFGVKLDDTDQIIHYAKLLQEKGAQNVLVSRAGDGAVLVAENGEVFTSPAPKGRVVNSVGAGDSMVAGFITGYIEQHDYKHAFKMGISAGSASAFSPELAEKNDVLAIYKTLNF